MGGWDRRGVPGRGNLSYSQKPLKAEGFQLMPCVLRRHCEVFKPGDVTVRFAFWNDNSGML